jgi:hypothetical protein
VRVALVTTWGTACGIAEHSAMLVDAVSQADPSIEFVPVLDLHPAAIVDKGPLDLVWLNYQAALHSQWTPEQIRIHQARGVRVGVTYHDTGVPNSDQCKAICAAADAFVVHEPTDDLPGNGYYWRMGVPALGPGEYHWGRETGWLEWPEQPVLGSIGFPFPWKNYDELAQATRATGWALYLIAPGASAADIMRWQAINPATRVIAYFMERQQVLRQLGACDATAFCYTCANTGQSGAVLQGIGARKPVIAFSSCRQFRALFDDGLASCVIRWTDSFLGVQGALCNVPIGRVDPGIVALAQQDSWRTLGKKYADLFRGLYADRHL